MICFWQNNAFCLRPEDDRELDALSVIYSAFREGLKPRPEENLGTGVIQNKYDDETRSP